MKDLFFSHSTHPFINGLGLLSLRLMFGLGMLMGHGWGKLAHFSDKVDSFPDPLGLTSPVSLVCAIITEVFCAGLVTVGLLTRAALIPLIFTMSVAVFFVHGGDAFADREMAMLYLFAYIGLFFTGPGKISLDYKFH